MLISTCGRALFALMVFTLSCAPKYDLTYPPERWLTDKDRQPIKKPPKTEEYLYWDAANMQFFYQLERVATLSERYAGLRYAWQGEGKQEALNVNNFDEVADSTWFTNRINRPGKTPSLAALARGSREGSGPDVTRSWTILSAKVAGLTPGFLIKDARGDLYLIKFDTPGYPELASGAEIIGTLLFHAFGYNVPENYVTYFDPRILKISPKATRKDRLGNKQPFTKRDLAAILKNVDRHKDGAIRVLASKFLKGKPLGPFPYIGVRQGDRNDRIPHQHRRELRGYRVFCAFLDHPDSREANTLDMFIKTSEDGRGYVKHHLY